MPCGTGDAAGLGAAGRVGEDGVALAPVVLEDVQVDRLQVARQRAQIDAAEDAAERAAARPCPRPQRIAEAERPAPGHEHGRLVGAGADVAAVAGNAENRIGDLGAATADAVGAGLQDEQDGHLRFAQAGRRLGASPSGILAAGISAGALASISAAATRGLAGRGG